MERLWAPWRAGYISKIGKRVGGCIFCRIVKSKKDREVYVFRRTAHSFAVLNLFPYSNGHVLVLPKRHINDLRHLTRAERDDLIDLLEDAKELIDHRLGPAGYNIGLNLGRAGGAGVPKHLHFHLVPRWPGDANFMPVTADTKVVSQSLDVLYELLSSPHKKKAPKRPRPVVRKK